MGNNGGRYLRTERAGGPTFNPTKDGPYELCFCYDSDEGKFQIWSIMVDPEVRRPMWPTRTTFSTQRCTQPYFLRDGTVVYHTDMNGNEAFQIGIIDNEVSSDTNVFSRLITTDRAAKHIISHTSNRYMYFRANIDMKSQFSIYRWRIPVRKNTAQLVYTPSIHRSIPKVSASLEDKFLLIEITISNVNQNLVLYDVMKKEESWSSEQLSKESTDEWRWYGVGWMDEDHILVCTDFSRDKMSLAVVNTKNNTLTFVEGVDPSYEIEPETVILRRDFYFGYNLVFFCQNINGFMNLYRATIEISGKSLITKVPLPVEGMLYSADSRCWTDPISISDDGNLIAVSFTTPTLPCNIWVASTRTKNMQFWQLTDVHTGGLDQTRFVCPSLRDFNSFDDLKVPYWRYIPKTKERPVEGFPVIIMVHGGPEKQAKCQFEPRVQFLLAMDYAVVVPNIRGSAGYGRKYLALDDKELRLNAIQDIKCLAKHLRIHDNDMGNKVCVMGGSYGGFATLSCLTQFPDAFDAGICMCGVTNYVSFFKNTASWRRAKREKEYGSLEHDLDVLQMISPINKAENLKAPLLMIYGAMDERVPITEAEQFYDIIKDRVPCRLLRLEDEGHGVTLYDNKKLVFSEILRFLKRNISPCKNEFSDNT